MNKAEILIIDDEEQIRKLLDITLRAHNYSVIEAATAKEGLIHASIVTAALKCSEAESGMVTMLVLPLKESAPP